MKMEAEERIIFSTDADEAHRQLKDDLEDITALNAKIQQENRNRDLQLEQSEVQLKKLKDMHISDIQQLEADFEHLKDDLGFKMKVQDERVSSLDSKKHRLHILESENSELKCEIRFTDDRLKFEGLQHAEVIHNLNKRMRDLRVEMEMTLKTKLTKMDQSFQHKAYSSLSDHKKRALLKNARLKDECTLQDSGLSNLWSRYNNQETACAAIHLELIELEMQEEKAMENVQHVMSAKAVTTSLISVTKEKQRKLLEMKKEIDTDLLSYPMIDNLRSAILKYENMLSSEGQCIRVWEERFRRLKAVEAILYEACSTETGRHYSTQDFPLAPLGTDSKYIRGSSVAPSVIATPRASSLRHGSFKSFTDVQEDTPYSTTNDSSNASSIRDSVPSKVTEITVKENEDRTIRKNKSNNEIKSLSTDTFNFNLNMCDVTKEIPYQVSLSQIGILLESDCSLRAAFRPLKGRENMLLNKPKMRQQLEGREDDVSESAEYSQNMVAWGALEILRIWRECKLQEQTSDASVPLLPTSDTAPITACSSLQTSIAVPAEQQSKSPLDSLEETSVCTAEGIMRLKPLGYSASKGLNDISAVSPQKNVTLDKNGDDGDGDDGDDPWVLFDQQKQQQQQFGISSDVTALLQHLSDHSLSGIETMNLNPFKKAAFRDGDRATANSSILDLKPFIRPISSVMSGELRTPIIGTRRSSANSSGFSTARSSVSGTGDTGPRTQNLDPRDSYSKSAPVTPTRTSRVLDQRGLTAFDGCARDMSGGVGTKKRPSKSAMSMKNDPILSTTGKKGNANPRSRSQPLTYPAISTHPTTSRTPQLPACLTLLKPSTAPSAAFRDVLPVRTDSANKIKTYLNDLKYSRDICGLINNTIGS